MELRVKVNRFSDSNKWNQLPRVNLLKFRFFSHRSQNFIDEKAAFVQPQVLCFVTDLWGVQIL